MTPNSFITNDYDELIVRGSHKRIPIYLLFLIVPCVALLTEPFSELKKFFSENLIATILLTAFMFISAGYWWFMVFDKRIKIIINKNGIWNAKSNFIEWKEISSYNFKEETFKTRKFHFLVFRTVGNDKEYKIDISFYNKSYEQIEEAVNTNSKGFYITNLGLNISK
jgi:hypothetical protein